MTDSIVMCSGNPGYTVLGKMHLGIDSKMEENSYLLIDSTILIAFLVLVCPFALNRLNIDKMVQVVKLLLLAFVVLIIILTIGIRSFDEEISVNLRLFQCYRGLLNQLSYKWRSYRFNYNAEQFRIITTGICNIIANIVLFMPPGYLLPKAFPKREFNWWKMLIIGALFSLTIEALQLVTHRGCFDLDDLFHNSIGTVVGFALGKRAGYSQKQT